MICSSKIINTLKDSILAEDIMTLDKKAKEYGFNFEQEIDMVIRII